MNEINNHTEKQRILDFLLKHAIDNVISFLTIGRKYNNLYELKEEQIELFLSLNNDKIKNFDKVLDLWHSVCFCSIRIAQIDRMGMA